MSEMYGIYTSKIKESLESKIFGLVDVRVKNDVLFIDIYSKEIEVGMALDKITDKILFGLSAEQVAQFVLRKFKREVVRYAYFSHLIFEENEEIA